MTGEKAKSMRLSLHRTKTPKDCDVCGVTIPVRKLPDYAEYWRAKGGPVGTPRTICCVCHFVFSFPEDGWAEAPNGRDVMAASVPHNKERP